MELENFADLTHKETQQVVLKMEEAVDPFRLIQSSIKLLEERYKRPINWRLESRDGKFSMKVYYPAGDTYEACSEELTEVAGEFLLDTVREIG